MRVEAEMLTLVVVIVASEVARIFGIYIIHLAIRTVSPIFSLGTFCRRGGATVRKNRNFIIASISLIISLGFFEGKSSAVTKFLTFYANVTAKSRINIAAIGQKTDVLREWSETEAL